MKERYPFPLRGRPRSLVAQLRLCIFFMSSDHAGKRSHTYVCTSYTKDRALHSRIHCPRVNI